MKQKFLGKYLFMDTAVIMKNLRFIIKNVLTCSNVLHIFKKITNDNKNNREKKMIDQMDLGSIVRIKTINNEVYEGRVDGKAKDNGNMWNGFVEITTAFEGLEVHHFINLSHVVSFCEVKEAEEEKPGNNIE